MSNEKRQPSDKEHLQRLYRQSADAEPESRVDDAVLGKARNAALAPRRRGLRHPGTWGLGMAAAASLVLAVGLYIDQGYRVEIDPLPAVNPEIRLEDHAMEEAGAAGTAGERVAPAAAPVIGEGETSTRQQADQAAYRAKRPGPAAGQGETGNSKAVEEDEMRSAAAPAEEPGDPDAEGWLARIERLIEAGNLEQARQEFREFRAAYPAATVPAGIRERLAEAPDEARD